VEALEARGLAVKLDTRDLEFGEKWRQQLKDFVRQADAVVFIVSPKSIQSRWCRWEVAQVSAESKRLVPVVHISVPADLVPAEISDIQLFQFRPTIDFTSDTEYDTLVSRLAEGLQKDRGWLQEHTRLNDVALDWKANDRKRDSLLRGSALAAAERWLASRPLTAPPPNSTQLELISASQTWAKQRARRWAAGLSAVTIGALSLAGVAYWQRDVAVQQERIAQEQRVAALHQQANMLGRLGNTRSGRDSALRFASQGARIDLGLPPDGVRVSSAAAALAAAVSQADWHHTLGPVISAAFSPDGTRIVTATDESKWKYDPGHRDKTARIWDAATAKEIAVLRGHDNWVASAAFSPDGSRIVTASGDKTARIWDAATAKEIVVLRGHQDAVESAAFSPDGKRIVTTSRDYTARIWDAATAKEIAVLRGVSSSAAFSPDGKRIVTVYDNTASIWDAATAKVIAVLRGDDRSVNSAAFSPDGKRIVTASYDKTARIWDAATAKGIAVLRGHEDVVESAAFSPDGSRIVTASRDNTARIWDAATAKEIAVLRGHNDGVSSAAFSRDGTRIITASYDKTARIWDAATTLEIAVLRGHGDWVDSAAFSPPPRRSQSCAAMTPR
jgi:WD40 repeat protein